MAGAKDDDQQNSGPREDADRDQHSNGADHSDEGDRQESEGTDAGAGADDDGPKSMAEALAKGIEEAAGGGKKKAADEGDDEEAEPPAKPAKAGPSLKEVQAKKDQQAGKPAEPKPGEPKVGDQTQPKEGEPPAAMDPINDPIPAYVKGKTRERMVALIETGKTLTADRDRYLGERNEIIGMIEQTKATPEQYGAALEYLAAVNSNDPARIKQAITTVQAELRALAGMIGEPVPGVDLTANYPDIQAEVKAGRITPQYAQEIAAARALREQQSAIGERNRENDAASAQVRRGQADLNALEVELRKDPLYEQKARQLIPVLKPLFATIPPTQWAKAFRDAYQNLQVTPSAPTPRTTTPSNANGSQPLRARSVAGNQSKPPSSMLEAMNAGLEEVASRR